MRGSRRAVQAIAARRTRPVRLPPQVFSLRLSKVSKKNEVPLFIYFFISFFIYFFSFFSFFIKGVQGEEPFFLFFLKFGEKGRKVPRRCVEVSKKEEVAIYFRSFVCLFVLLFVFFLLFLYKRGYGGNAFFLILS